MAVRPGQADDLDAIRAIRNRAVEATTAIWTETTQTPAEARDWLAGYLERAAMFVAVDDGAVVGYACWGPWREKDGYRHTAEHSVYVAEGHQRRGIGRTLLRTVLQEAPRHGLHVLVAGIESRNTASIRLHEELGFEHAGTVREVGTKFGRWLDLTFMQRTL